MMRHHTCSSAISDAWPRSLALSIFPRRFPDGIKSDYTHVRIMLYIYIYIHIYTQSLSLSLYIYIYMLNAMSRASLYLHWPQVELSHACMFFSRGSRPASFLRLIRGNHSSNTTHLKQAFCKSGGRCSRLWRSLTLRKTRNTTEAALDKQR